MLSFCLLSPRWQARALKLRRWDKSQLSHSVQCADVLSPALGSRSGAITNNMEHRLTCTSNRSHLLPPVSRVCRVQPWSTPTYNLRIIVHCCYIFCLPTLQNSFTLYLMTELGDLHPHNSDADHVQGGEETLNFKLTHFNSKWWLSRFFDSLNFVQIVKVK